MYRRVFPYYSLSSMWVMKFVNFYSSLGSKLLVKIMEINSLPIKGTLITSTGAKIDTDLENREYRVLSSVRDSC